MPRIRGENIVGRPVAEASDAMPDEREEPSRDLQEHPNKKQAERVGRWAAPAVAGAVAFWLVNLAISATPVAADYRQALSIRYAPMLAEAAVGGLVLGGVFTFLLLHHPSKIPGSTLLTKALVLGVVTLALVTIGIEAPSKLTSGVDAPAHWLLVASIVNLLRLLVLAATVGLVADVRARPRSRPEPRVEGRRDGTPP